MERERTRDLSSANLNPGNPGIGAREPEGLDDSNADAATAATREVAARLADLARTLEGEGRLAPEAAASLLMRRVFAIVAEQVGVALEPAPEVGERTSCAPPSSDRALRLFAELSRCRVAEVEPTIFGALLERALDPRERHALGAHFTPRAYVERLVRWTVEEPLYEDWTRARAEARRLASMGRTREAASAALIFHAQLCATRVLDPACGTGNFLCVALDLLMRLEAEVLAHVRELGVDPGPPRVTPAQLLGIEVKQSAKEIAALVLQIGYLQAHLRAHGRPPSSLVVPGDPIEHRDALLAWDGEAAARRPRKAAWPSADFVVGNPPFMGGSRMRATLGGAYVEALREAHNDVPESCDLVMYWWNHAARLAADREVRRVGLITTNSVTQALNRKAIHAHLDAGRVSLAAAVPDHPWTTARDRAAVRIAMTVLEPAGHREGTLYLHGVAAGSPTLTARRGQIHADLTIGPTATAARRLRANEGLASPGVKLHGAGFIVTEADARALGLGRAPGLSRHLRPYRNGRDLTGTPRGAYVIDLDGLAIDEVRARYPEVYRWVSERVKPGREGNNEAYRRERWWLFGRPNTELRAALRGLGRYVATAETSKHRVFVFLDAAILPDNMLVNIALDDAFYLGVLSSRAHVTWALAAGGRLGVGNDPRYTKTRCFDTFPFPACSEAQRRRIRALGEALDAHRKARQQACPELTVTAMYNALEKIRAGAPLGPKEALACEQGLLRERLLSIHDELDAAVMDAYGWPRDRAGEGLVAALAALNAERAEEERVGHVRWLRPELQDRARAAPSPQAA